MKHRQFLIILSLLLITLVLTLTSCQDRPAVESTPFDTKSTKTPTSREKDYAFLQSPLCQQVRKSERDELFPPFRNAPNVRTLTTTQPTVPITAKFPQTIVINSKTCPIGEKLQHKGRTVIFQISEVDKKFPSSDCLVEFDVVTGEVLSIYNAILRKFPVSEIKDETDLIFQASKAIKEYCPTLNLDEYQTITTNHVLLENGSGQINFKKTIGGVSADNDISVLALDGAIVDISTLNAHQYDGFDEALLNFDKEEHEQMIQSFAEYVCNGYDLISAETIKTTLVKEADGSYAIEYRLWITADTEKETDSRESFDFRISLR